MPHHRILKYLAKEANSGDKDNGDRFRGTDSNSSKAAWISVACSDFDGVLG
jgi:hypothetical protein